MSQAGNLNKIYEAHKDNCPGSFHSALWQIMMNKSCSGAFTYITTEQQVAVAQENGGYIPALFDIPDKEKRKSILADLNRKVFGLTSEGADRIIATSFRKTGQ